MEKSTSKNKFVDPHFTKLWNEDIPKCEFKDSSRLMTTIDVIAGKLDRFVPPNPPPNSWAADPDNQVAAWTIEMEAGAEWTFPSTNEGINRVLYIYKWQSLEIDGTTIQPMNGV